MRISLKSLIIKKHLALFGIYLFICNTLIFPTLHRADIFLPHNTSCCTVNPDPHSPYTDHTAENKLPPHNNTDSHNDDCMICKIIATATITPHNTTPAPAYNNFTGECVIPVIYTITDSTYSAKLQARAPPLFI
jgi:hypothetical protein